MAGEQRDLSSRYANLSAEGGEMPVATAESQPVIKLGTTDVQAINDLAAKGNLSAIGEYVLSLLK